MCLFVGSRHITERSLIKRDTSASPVENAMALVMNQMDMLPQQVCNSSVQCLLKPYIKLWYKCTSIPNKRDLDHMSVVSGDRQGHTTSSH